MNFIQRWFGCPNPEQEYRPSNDLESKNRREFKAFPSDRGDETLEALKTWESKFPKDKCETGGIVKTYEYAHKVLNDLHNSPALSLSNADEIGCHLWALAKTSESRTGRESMYHYFIDHLPKVLGNENKEIAAKIHCSMIGSENRQKYAEADLLSNLWA